MITFLMVYFSMVTFRLITFFMVIFLRVFFPKVIFHNLMFNFIMCIENSGISDFYLDFEKLEKFFVHLMMFNSFTEDD